MSSVNTGEFCKEVIKEYNKCRTDPKSYVEILNEMKKNFKGKILNLPGTTVGIKTKEGPEAFDDAINFLNKENKVKELKENNGLNHVSLDMLKQITALDDVDEIDKVDTESILDKYGEFGGKFISQVVYGAKDPQKVIIDIIVNDGDKKRGLRDSFFNSKLKQIGVASEKEEIYGQITLITLAFKYTPNDIGSKEIGKN